MTFSNLDNAISALDDQPLAAQKAEPCAKKKRVLELVLVFATAITPFVIVSLFVVSGLHYPTNMGTWHAVSLLNTITMEVLALALLVYVLGQQERDLRDIGFSFRWQDLPVSLLLFVGTYFLYSCCYVLYAGTYVWWTGAALKPQDSTGFGLRSGFTSLAIIFAVVNPIFEEVLVRAFGICEIIALTGRKWIAIGAVVLIQIVYHLYQGVANALLIGVIMLVFSIYYARTRRVMPLVLAHMYLDLIAVARLAGK